MGQLYDAFAASLDPNPTVRSNAEQQLNSSLKHDLFSTLLSIIETLTSTSATDSVTVSATVFLKNTIYTKWTTANLSTDQKSNLQSSLLQATVNISSHVLRDNGHGNSLAVLNNLTAIIAFLISCESAWLALLGEHIQTLLSNQQEDTQQRQSLILTGILCVIEILRYFRWRLHDQSMHAPRRSLIESIMPVLAHTANPVNSDIILWKIFKAYKFAVSGDFPEILQQDGQLNSWMTLFLSSITQKQGKPRKWGLANIQTLLHYAVLSQSEFSTFHYPKFAQTFLTNFAPETCRIYLQITNSIVSPLAASNSFDVVSGLPAGYESSSDLAITKRFLLTFFYESIKLPSLFPILVENIQSVLSLIYASVRLDGQDLANFNSDIDAYVYAQFVGGDDIDDFNLTPHSAALSCNKQLSDLWPQAITDFVQRAIASQSSSSGTSPAAAFIPGAVAPVATSTSNVASSPTVLTDQIVNIDAALQMLQSLAAVAFPSAYQFLNHPSPVLAARACYLARLSASSIAESLITDITKTIVELLIFNKFGNSSSGDIDETAGNDISKPRSIPFDSIFIVQYEAALAIHAILIGGPNEKVLSLLEPHAITIMEAVVRLYDRTDVSCTESLGDFVCDLVEHFSAKLLPHATQLIARLSSQCLEMLEDLDDSSEEDEIEAIHSLCSTISTVISAASLNHPSTSAATGAASAEPLFDGHVASLVNVIFAKSELDLYSDAVDLLTSLCVVHKQVTQSVWSIFDHSIWPAFQADPISCVEEAIQCISAFSEYSSDYGNRSSVFHVLAYALSCDSSVRPLASIQSQISVLCGSFTTEFLAAVEDQDPSMVLDNWDIVRVLRCILIRSPMLLGNILMRDSLLCQPMSGVRDATIIAIAILRGFDATDAVGSAPWSDNPIQRQLFSRLIDAMGIAYNVGGTAAASNEGETPQANESVPRDTRSISFVNEAAQFYNLSVPDSAQEDAPRLDSLLGSFDIKAMYGSLLSQMPQDTQQALVQMTLSKKQTVVHYSILR